MQHTAQHALATTARARSRRPAGRRVLHRALATAALVLAFALAGQSAAQAAYSSGAHGPGHTWSAGEHGAGTPPAAAPAPAPAPPPAATGGVPAYKNYALAKLGGNTPQFNCLNSLWTAESGWNPNAQNPTSTAYGIAQFLNGTWATTGIAKTSNPLRQIDAGLIYIANRYGSPCAAWAHFRANHWY